MHGDGRGGLSGCLALCGPWPLSQEKSHIGGSGLPYIYSGLFNLSGGGSFGLREKPNREFYRFRQAAENAAW